MTYHFFSGDLFKKVSHNNTTLCIRHKSETSLTAMIWLFSLCMIFMTGQQMVFELSAISSFRASLSFYGQALALISVMTISWSFFRLFRYKQSAAKKREKPGQARLDEVRELVKIFKLAPEVIAELRRSNTLNVKFGTTKTSSTLPVDIAKELTDDHTIYLCS